MVRVWFYRHSEFKTAGSSVAYYVSTHSKGFKIYLALVMNCGTNNEPIRPTQSRVQRKKNCSGFYMKVNKKGER